MDTVRPESQGFSSARLTRLDTRMQHYVDENKIAGVITLVARRGQVVHFGMCGMADRETGRKMQEDTIFRIYSMTKPITTVAALMLYEEARFRLTDPVAQYIPVFKDVQVLDNTPGSGVKLVAPARPMTIRDLMTHTAGLSYGFEENCHIDELYRQNVWGVMDANPSITLAEMVEAVGKQPLAFHPGERWRYSVATDVLGYLVEVVSGMPFQEFLRERIFEPLGMRDTAFYVPPEKLDRFSACYGPDTEAGLKVVDAPATSRYTQMPGTPSGGGGLVSTTSDYLRFAQMLANHGTLGEARLLGRKTVELMTSAHFPLDEKYADMGLGVSVLRDLGQGQQLGSVGNFGWGGAANTDFWVDPREELIGVLMLQFMPGGTYPVGQDFRILTYQALVD